MEIFKQFKMWTEKVEQREGNGLVKEAVHLIHQQESKGTMNNNHPKDVQMT